MGRFGYHVHGACVPFAMRLLWSPYRTIHVRETHETQKSAFITSSFPCNINGYEVTYEYSLSANMLVQSHQLSWQKFLKKLQLCASARSLPLITGAAVHQNHLCLCLFLFPLSFPFSFEGLTLSYSSLDLFILLQRPALRRLQF